MKILALLASLLMLAPGSKDKDSYTNPILFSDYSDPDVIRVGDDYWMTSSSFTCYPGLQILHSTNLVDWEIVGAALPDPGPAFDVPSHGNGVFAPCIRYHEGRYWIFWGDPDKGIFQVNTTDPRGEWSKPHLVLEGKGLIDTSPLWDDDGRVYLAHAWAGSRAGFKSILNVCELDKDCTRVIGDQVLVFDGKKNGNDTVEGAKFYKRNGWYYIFAPAGGVKEGWQLVMRSRNVYGPYEFRNVMHQGNTDIHGPHQGGWVTDVAGNDWFLHFEDRYAWGRVCHLQPMSWSDDDWCIIGIDQNGDGIGEPVLKHGRPAVAEKYRGTKLEGVSAVATTTGFTGTSIPLNWQWEANPKFNWYMLNPSLGCLRLNCIQNPEGWKNLRDTPNILAQKVVGPSTEFTTKLVYRPSYAGERVGVIVTGRSYSTIELNYDGEKLSLVRRDCINANKGAAEEILCSSELSKEAFNTIWFRVKVEKNCICTFSYSLDGRKFKTLGPEFTGREGDWIGAKIGYFATAEIKKNDGGSVEVY
jgi:beta-xylosidase